ncbi:MAG: Grx4 family monothiol glutaredoxin [Chlamydiales bacterium]|nr:Grx4 family monothiol glutaredoxin [Chlamydiales bacterium]
MLDQSEIEEAKKQIAEDIKENAVVLYMKGSKLMPMCGFSQKVAFILGDLKVKYLDRNVLEDDALRQGIKEFSDWPTIPQLYIKGEFIGGCDIVLALYESGELQEMLETV